MNNPIYAKAKKHDDDFGLPKENEMLPLMKKTFDETICKSKHHSVFDYEGVHCFAELKSRRVKHNQYLDTMIGTNKIDLALRCGKEVFLCFHYTDGAYFYKFDKDDLENENITFRIGGRCDRGRDERKQYAYIKTKCLKRF